MATSSSGATSRVVITGTGVVSPIGIGAAAFWDSLLMQRSGICHLRLTEGTEMPVRIGGCISDFEAKQYVKPRKSLKVMSREIQTGVTAAAMAMQEAKLHQHQIDAERFGVVYGCEMLYCELDELEDAYRRCMPDGVFDFSLWGDRAIGQMFPLFMLKYLPNMVACHIGIAHDARGPNNTITMGDASSLLAVIEATRIIERGDADVMIAGGAGSRLSLTPMMYRGDMRVSHRSDDPPSASRPFDADRDGMVNGEGAGAFVLETLEHALSRGAPLLAELAGSGMSFESPGLGSKPRGKGIQQAIARALQEAELTANDVDHVNAHGLSTIEDDAMEAQAIRATIGEVAVTAPKSFFGNLGAGSGAVEMAATVLACQRGQVPVTLNFETSDPQCPVHVVSNRARTVRKEAAVVLNHSSTGQAAAVVLKQL